MDRFFLQPHVYACATSDAAIFLDLEHNQYLGLDEPQMRALRRVLKDWETDSPLEHDGQQSEEALAAAIRFADSLVQRGLLTKNERCARVVDAAKPQRVTASLLDEGDDFVNPGVRFSHVWKLMIACGYAAYSLRLRRLDKVVGRVYKRKCRNVSARKTVDLAELRHLTRVFYWLRKFFYTSQDKCLFDSLVLVEFLARHRIFPTWTFGVQSFPFTAHSWVQMGPYVLNGAPPALETFSPILSI